LQCDDNICMTHILPERVIKTVLKTVYEVSDVN
jgi:hypothetical protein